MSILRNILTTFEATPINNVFLRARVTVDAITPVPGGVGAVTGTVLMEHLVTAAERKCRA